MPNRVIKAIKAIIENTRRFLDHAIIVLQLWITRVGGFIIATMLNEFFFVFFTQTFFERKRELMGSDERNLRLIEGIIQGGDKFTICCFSSFDKNGARKLVSCVQIFVRSL